MDTVYGVKYISYNVSEIVSLSAGCREGFIPCGVLYQESEWTMDVSKGNNPTDTKLLSQTFTKPLIFNVWKRRRPK